MKILRLHAFAVAAAMSFASAAIVPSNAHAQADKAAKTEKSDKGDKGEKGNKGNKGNKEDKGGKAEKAGGAGKAGPGKSDADKKGPTKPDTDKKGPVKPDADKKSPAKPDADKKGATQPAGGQGKDAPKKMDLPEKPKAEKEKAAKNLREKIQKTAADAEKIAKGDFKNVSEATRRDIAESLKNHFDGKSATPKFDIGNGAKVWLEKRNDGSVAVQFTKDF